PLCPPAQSRRPVPPSPSGIRHRTCREDPHYVGALLRGGEPPPITAIVGRPAPLLLLLLAGRVAAGRQPQHREPYRSRKSPTHVRIYRPERPLGRARGQSPKP